jgi:hypothetical protein
MNIQMALIFPADITVRVVFGSAEGRVVELRHLRCFLLSPKNCTLPARQKGCTMD